MVLDLIEVEPAAVIAAGVFVIGTEVCVAANAFAIDPNGMILMAVIVSRDAVVKVTGEGCLGHESTEEGEGSGDELHCVVVFGINLRMKWL